MAFNNKEVLKTVLKAVESDKAVRESSLELSGFPLNYILHINPNLDYLRWMLHHIHARHRVVEDNFIRADFSSIDIPSDVKWFIDFSCNIASIFENYDFLNKYNSNPEIKVDYFSESYSKTDEYGFASCVNSGTRFILSKANGSLFAELDDALFCYQEYMLSVLKFLADGVNLKENSSDEEVTAWVSLFHLFSTVDPWYDVYKIVDSDYPNSEPGFMKRII